MFVVQKLKRLRSTRKEHSFGGGKGQSIPKVPEHLLFKKLG